MMTPIFSPTIKELREICKKGQTPKEWQLVHWGEKINRSMTVYLTWLLLRFRATPDQVTVLGMFFTFIGFAFFVFNNLFLQIVGLAVIFFSFLLDGSDGEMARYRKVKGLAENHYDLGGIYIEPMSHDMQYAFVFLPVGIGSSLVTGSLTPFVFAFVATSAKLLFRLAECRYNAYETAVLKSDNAKQSQQDMRAPRATIFYFMYRHIFTSSMFFYTLAIAVALRHVEWFLYFYAAGFSALLIYKMLKQRRRINKLIKL